MANENIEIHVETEGLQWEVSKNNISGTDYGTADDLFHHDWQELSFRKNIRSLNEASIFFEADEKNKTYWNNVRYPDIIKNTESEFIKNSFDVDSNGNFENPISTFALVKTLSKYNTYADRKTSSSLKNEINNNKYNYEDYLNDYERSANDYDGSKFLGTYKTLKDVDAVKKQYSVYGSLEHEEFVNNNGDTVYKVYIPAETQAEIYNKTEAIKLAKLKAITQKSKDKDTLKNTKSKLVEDKQREAIAIAVFKDYANKNDKIRKQKRLIEEIKAEEEQQKENLKAAEESERKSAENANSLAADKYEAEMSKAGTPISAEEKANYLNKLNNISNANISSKYKAKIKKVTDRTGTLTARAEAATTVESTSDLFSSMEAEASKKKSGFLSKLSGLAGAASDLYNKISDTLNGKLDLSKLDNVINSKLGFLNNNKFLNKLTKQLGLKEGLFDNVASDFYKLSASFTKDALNSSIKLGMSKLMGLTSNNDVIDNVLLTTIKPLVYSGGDPNYNGTFLKYILLADCPKCLEYLDNYNGISKYTFESPGKEYKRGETAAKNGCHKTALYVAKKLYDEYKIYISNTIYKDDEKASKYSEEIRKIFKTAVVNSYNNFDVGDLKNWFNSFSDILHPCILGTGDIYYSGKNKITSSDINTIAKIVDVSEVKSGLNGAIKFDITTGMKNDKDNGEKFGKNTISNTRKYIDVRNKNIKKIYIYLVGNGFIKCDRLTHKELHDRLSYPALSSLSKAKNNLANNIAKSDTFNDLAYVENNVVRASIHNTLNMMAGNNLIPFASSNSGVADFNDTTGMVPEFKDYSSSTITFYNHDCSKSYEQIVLNGKSTNLESNTFERIGYKFIGWAKSPNSSDVVYTNKSKITINSDLKLYSTWEVVSGDGTQGGQDNDTTIIDNYVNNSITEEEILEKIENILSKVESPNLFKKYDLSFNDFKCIDSTINNIEISTINNYTSVFDKTLKSYSDKDNAYSVLHYTTLYINNEDKFKNIENEIDKTKIYYYVLAYTIVKYLAKTLVYSSLDAMFGLTEVVNSYKIDDNGIYILDIYGNKIIDNSKNVNSVDLEFKAAMEIFREACSKIYEYYLSVTKQNRYIVKFDLCGLSSEHIPSFSIGAYDSIEDYEPVEPEVEGFIFKGWSTDPAGSHIIDWKSDIFYTNTILFAIWEKSECYIKDFTLRKDKNDSLLEDVVGNVDNSEEIIRLYMRSSEVSENHRYYFHIDLPYGCSCDTDYKQKILISETSMTQINITDPFGNEKHYIIELFIIGDEESRISYIVDGGNVSNNAIYSQEQNTELTSLPLVTKDGYNFIGWSIDNKAISQNIEVGNISTVLYALYDEPENSITYLNCDEEPFDGTHDLSYNTTIKYNEAKIIDKPTKKGYVFDGYYRDKKCVTERINALYRYNYSEDTTLYANWIDEGEYAALHGTIKINGIDVKLSETMFYTKMIMSNNDRWCISGTGLNVFASNGNKLKSLTGLIGGKSYIPEGIATIGFETNSTILVVVRHSSKNKTYVYYTPDRGLTWFMAIECTKLNLLLSDSTGAETVNFLTFYQSVIYNGHIYSVDFINNESSIIVDGNENVILSSSNSQFNITNKRKILGISVTVEGKLYVLFENVGVISYTNFEPVFDNDGKFNSNNQYIQGEGVAGWLDNYYTVNYSNIGNPYTAVKFNFNLNDDFDINDEMIVENLNMFNEDKYKYIKTYLKVEDNDDPISDTIWLWSYGLARTGIILSEKSWIIENMNNFKPSIIKDRGLIQLSVKPNNKRYVQNKTLDPEEIRKVHMTMDNCLDYLGWSRVIYDNEGNISEIIKITRDYLHEMEILDGSVAETWDIKYTRSELITKEIVSAIGEHFIAEVYNAPEIEPSNVYLNYLRSGKL